jgi:hypothetical protein
MSKHKDPLLIALSEGKSYTWTVPDGGDLASMRKAIKHGQTLTMSPVTDPSEIQAGDLVLVKWHKGDIFHIVGEIKDDQYLIVNSLGKVNGWVRFPEILGRITEIVEPEPCPDVPGMLAQLTGSFQKVIEQEKASPEDARRITAILEDLRWYAAKIGSERWQRMPRSNIWSLEQNLWRLTKQVRDAKAPVADRTGYFIDLGKACVGKAAEIFAFFEYSVKEG